MLMLDARPKLHPSDRKGRQEDREDQVRVVVVNAAPQMNGSLKALLEKEADLVITLLRVTEEEDPRESLDLFPEKPSHPYLQRIAVPRAGGVIVYPKTKDVDYFQAANQYVQIFTGKNKYLIRQSLQSLEEDLDPRLFLRVHRSAIVNLERIRELQMASPTDRYAVLQCGQRIRVSPRRWQRLQEALVKA